MDGALGNVIWRLVCQSDGATWVILGVLLCMSMVSWAIMMYKWFVFRVHLREIEIVQKALKSVQTSEELHRLLGTCHEAVTASLMQQGIRGLALREWNDRERRQEWRDALAHDVDQILVHEAEQVPALRIAAEAAPLLGLLGTIWGLIHSFVGISVERVADIVTVAPGIAEALITTLAGLLVAIPALVFYHILQSKIDVIEHALWRVADTIEQVVTSLRRQGE